MSTCDSFKSPEVEYIDNNDVPAVDSINRKTFSNLFISDHDEKAGVFLFQFSVVVLLVSLI
jgi:cyclin A